MSSEEATFIRQAHATARLNGACVLEFTTCPSCDARQFVTHAFAEVVACGNCGQRIASCVPRMELPGEVTKLMLDRAITIVRQAYPEVNPETRAWLEKQEGAVRTVATTWACHEVRKALDLVMECARAMTGAHSKVIEQGERP